MSLFGIGTIIYVTLLMLNAMAILSEDRFLARSMSSAYVVVVLLRPHLPFSWLGINFTSSPGCQCWLSAIV